MVIENLHDQPVTVAMHFKVNGVTDRAARLARADGEVLWQGRVEATHATQVDLNKVRLKPGANRLVFTSSLPPQRAPGDTRLLDLCVKDLQVDVDD